MIVEWTESALDRLADLFVTADLAEQAVMEAAVVKINSDLAVNPWNLGESRTEGRRMWFVEPLVVIFRVVPTKEQVVVLAVGRSR
jgi:hypothetical protein